jgi:hypothetical protein
VNCTESIDVLKYKNKQNNEWRIPTVPIWQEVWENILQPLTEARWLAREERVLFW